MSFTPRALVRSVVAAGPATPMISTLTDNFASDDAAKWTHVIVGSATYAVASGQAQCTLVNAAGTNTAGIDTNVAYDMTSDGAFVRYAQSSSASSNNIDRFRIYTDANNHVNFNRSGAAINAQKTIAGVQTTVYGPSYVAGTHAWLRIREASGTIYWDTAPSTASNPPISGDWVNFTSAPVFAGFTPSLVFVKICALTFAAQASPGVAAFDGYNGAT